MYYKTPVELQNALNKLEEQRRAVYAEIMQDRREFFAQLVTDGWQRYVVVIRYSDAYDPWGAGGLRRDGDEWEDVYYFAPHVQIPEFEEFIQTYSNNGTGELDEFMDSLLDKDWYEE